MGFGKKLKKKFKKAKKRAKKAAKKARDAAKRAAKSAEKTVKNPAHLKDQIEGTVKNAVKDTANLSTKTSKTFKRTAAYLPYGDSKLVKSAFGVMDVNKTASTLGSMGETSKNLYNSVAHPNAAAKKAAKKEDKIYAAEQAKIRAADNARAAVAKAETEGMNSAQEQFKRARGAFDAKKERVRKRRRVA